MIQNRRIIIPDSCPLNFESIGSLLYNVAPYNQKWHRGDKINLQIYSDDSQGLSLLILDKRDVFVKEIPFEDFKSLNGYRYANLSYKVDLKDGAYYFIIKDVPTQAWLARTPMNEIGFFRNTSYLEATNDVNDFGTIVQDTTPIYPTSGVAPKRYFGGVYGTGTKQLFDFSFDGIELQPLYLSSISKGDTYYSGRIDPPQPEHPEHPITGTVIFSQKQDENILVDSNGNITAKRDCVVKIVGKITIDFGSNDWTIDHYPLYESYISIYNKLNISVTENMFKLIPNGIEHRLVLEIPINTSIALANGETTRISYNIRINDGRYVGYYTMPVSGIALNPLTKGNQQYYDDFYYIIENQVLATAKLISSTGIELDCTNEVIDGVNYLKSPDIRTLTGGLWYYWKITRQDGSIVTSPSLMATYNSIEGKFGVPSLSNQYYNPYDKMRYIITNEVSAIANLVCDNGNIIQLTNTVIDGENYLTTTRLDTLDKLGRYKLVATYLNGDKVESGYLYVTYNDTIGWFCDTILHESTRFNYGESEFIISHGANDDYIYVTCEQNSINWELTYNGGHFSLCDEFDNVIDIIRFSNNDDTYGIVDKMTGIEINKKLYVALFYRGLKVAQSDYFYFFNRKIYTQNSEQYQCNIRVEAHVDPDSDEYKADISDYVDQEGDNISVYNLPTTTYTWYVGENNGVPAWMRKKLNLYLQFKELRLNFENVTKSNGEQTFKQEQKIEKTGMSILSMKFQERETTYVSSEIIALGNMNRLLSFNGKILKT